MDATKEIKFYNQHKRPYGAFSNFSPHPILIGGNIWPTVEHYFQGMKFSGTPHEADIRAAETPGAAKNLARSMSGRRSDWSEIKDKIMFDGCYAKFSQHEDLKKLLLDTGDAVIIEHTKNDSYWGDGGDGSGRNQLGKTLMQCVVTIPTTNGSLSELSEEIKALKQIRAIRTRGRDCW